jgi:DNA-binding transcriptional LysR family regulator
MRGRVRLGLLPGLGLVDLLRWRESSGDGIRAWSYNFGSRLRDRPGMVAALRNGDIDVGFLGIAGKVHPDLRSWELLRVPQILAVPTKHRLARRQAVALADLAGEDFVDFPRASGPRVDGPGLRCRRQQKTPDLEEQDDE